MADDSGDKAFPDGEFTEAELKELGQCNALTNQEAKLLFQQFTTANMQASKTWALPPLAQKAMDYLEKVEPKIGPQHKETVGRFRELKQTVLYEYELVLLTNLTPGDVNEAVTLVPSLQRLVTEDRASELSHILEQIITLKQMQ